MAWTIEYDEGPSLWRYRLRDYRFICQLQKSRLVVLFVSVGHRTAIIRRLKTIWTPASPCSR